MDFPAYLPDLYEDDYCYFNNYHHYDHYDYNNCDNTADINEAHAPRRGSMPACQFVLDAQLIWPAFRFPHHGQHFQPLAPPVIELAAPLEALEMVEAAPPKPRQQREKKARERDVGVWKRAQPVVDEEKRGNPANRKKTKKKQQQLSQQQRGRERGRYFDDESTSSESVATSAPLALLHANHASTSNNNNNNNSDSSNTGGSSAPPVERAFLLDESESDTLRDLSTQEGSLSLSLPLSLSSATTTATATVSETAPAPATERATTAVSVSACAATEKKKPLALVEKRRGERARDDGLVFRTIDPDTGEFMEIVYGFQNARVVPDCIPASSSNKSASSYAANTAEDISDVTDGD